MSRIRIPVVHPLKEAFCTAVQSVTSALSMAAKKRAILAGKKGPVAGLRSGLNQAQKAGPQTAATFQPDRPPSLSSWARDRTCI